MKSKIMVCDSDSDYVSALCAYIVSSEKNFSVTSHSRINTFEKQRGSFDVMLLSREFADVYYSMPKDNIKCSNVIILTGDINDTAENEDTLFKFQSMRIFMTRIKRACAMSGGIDIASRKSGRYVGMISPMHHELSEIFAMGACRYMEEKGNAPLFIDLMANSILQCFIPEQAERGIMDYLYLVKAADASKNELLECITYYGDIAYIAPARHFGELSCVDEDCWRMFFETIDEMGFSRVVVLFEDNFTGYGIVLSRLKKIIEITKEGDYYSKFSRRLSEYLQEKYPKLERKEIKLNLSAGNLKDGDYSLESIITGNLMNYIKRIGE